MDLSVRSIVEGDLGLVVRLIREFAEFEGLANACEVDEDRLRKAMFAPGACVEGLIAEAAGEPVGYALYFPNFSSFRGQRGFYLDDLYVREGHRGSGAGRMMIAHIAAEGRRRGFERIDLLVLDWNKPALGFYERLGAVADPDERHHKFTDQAFRRLAGG